MSSADRSNRAVVSIAWRLCSPDFADVVERLRSVVPANICCAFFLNDLQFTQAARTHFAGKILPILFDFHARTRKLFDVACPRLSATERVPVKEKQTQKIITQTKTQTVQPKQETSTYDLLEPLEEKVLRMHYGLSENDDIVLEYAVGASQDSRMKVTLMEAGNIADLKGNVPVAAGADKKILGAFAAAHTPENNL